MKANPTNSIDHIEVEKRSDIQDKPFRFIDRDELLGRSTGRFNIVRIGENSSYIYIEDWFHTIASLATHKVIILILVLYFVSVIFWAALFYLFRDSGFVDITTFVAAMIISLETITTVGYSVSDINFGDHPIAFFLLYGEMMQAILMNSFCIGIVYTRLSRAITRSRSLIFSDKAIIKRIDGQWYLVFQVCELRKHQLVESHVSCYCVQKTVSEASGVPFQMTRMRLTHPSNDQHGRLVLMLPAFICHPIDVFSPLFPDLEPIEKHTATSSEDIANIRISRCFTSSHLNESQVGLLFSPHVEVGAFAERPGAGVALFALQRGVRQRVHAEPAHPEGARQRGAAERGVANAESKSRRRSSKRGPKRAEREELNLHVR